MDYILKQEKKMFYWILLALAIIAEITGIEERYRLLTFEYAFRQVGFIVLLGIIVAAIAAATRAGAASTRRGSVHR